MDSSILPKPQGISRIVYKEIVEGDREKFKAKSNISESGGGARDLRFRPYDRFLSVFEKILPEKDERGICVGEFRWMEGDTVVSKSAHYHPPTQSRSGEGRIANVDRYMPKHGLPTNEEGITVLLFVQRDDNTVWLTFVTEHSLRSAGWHPSVKEIVLGCIDARRRAGVSMCGFVDFETGETFCNGQ